MQIPEHMCTPQNLADALKETGVMPGMTLIVHSSMKKLGWVPGGARTVVDALLAAIGPEGTLVMPAQTGDNSDPAYWVNPPVPQAWWDEIRQVTPAFDPAISPTRKMGAVVECFRTYPGVQRSNNPIDSFIALGPQATTILARHDLDCSLGDDSPCGALERGDAHVLLLGVDFDNCTVMHLAEYRGQARTLFRQSSAILQDGQRVWVEYPQLDLDSDDFLPVGREMEQAGLVRQTKLHLADLRLFRVRDAVSATQDWLKRNRLRRLGEADRERVMDYLKLEPEYNLFIIGDIENEGMSSVGQDVLSFDKDGAIDSILLRYRQSFIPYSQNPDFAVEPLVSAIQTPNLRIISGKKSVMERLQPHLSNFNWQDTYLMKLGRDELVDAQNRPEPADCCLKAASLEDVPAIVDFVGTIAEFSITMSREARLEMLSSSIKGDNGHYFIYENNGQLIAVAGTSAENSLSAMVVSVATHPDWRGRGLASRLVSELARTLLAERLQYLCLFYDNPDAGRIYRRLGFKDAGQWVMAIRKNNQEV